MRVDMHTLAVIIPTKPWPMPRYPLLEACSLAGEVRGISTRKDLRAPALNNRPH